jgi:hypothetical protein
VKISPEQLIMELQFVRNFQGEIIGMKVPGTSIGEDVIPNVSWTTSKYKPQVPLPSWQPGIPEL